MKTSAFSKLYNLKQLDVVEIGGNNGNLSITMHVETHSDFVANGFRTEFDFSLKHRFTFLGVEPVVTIKNPVISDYRYENSYLYINIDEFVIKIPEVDILVEQNI
ncbi:MAG: hypothetical protein MJ238_07590 [Bacilli bacterium]|nr:hypothetical protein [Bacilli bacterium]